MERTARIALTGTPGSGKSTVAELLSKRFAVEEVSELAVRLGAGRRTRSGVEVDLVRLARRLRTDRSHRLPDVLVGHLAHLLPIRDAIVLRCHPVELSRRLTRHRGGSKKARYANFEAEATDLILVEAVEARRRIWEVDTTGRSATAVAREVGRIVQQRVRPRLARVNWLADPKVTDYLLRRAR